MLSPSSMVPQAVDTTASARVGENGRAHGMNGSLPNRGTRGQRRPDQHRGDVLRAPQLSSVVHDKFAMTDGLRSLLPPVRTVASAELAEARRPAAPSGSSSSAFREALRAAARGIARDEARLDAVLAQPPGTLAPEQLLALQATVHRYSREVELAGKLADKLTGAVRQVLTSQQ